jgi:hypothetical protein
MGHSARGLSAPPPDMDSDIKTKTTLMKTIPMPRSTLPKQVGPWWRRMMPQHWRRSKAKMGNNKRKFNVVNGLPLSLTTEDHRIKKTPWWLNGMSSDDIPDEIPETQGKVPDKAPKNEGKESVEDFEFDVEACRLPPPEFTTDLEIPEPKDAKKDSKPTDPATTPDPEFLVLRTKSRATRNFARDLPTAPRDQPSAPTKVHILLGVLRPVFRSFAVFFGLRDPPIIEHTPEEIQLQATKARIVAKHVKVGEPGRKVVVASIQVGKRMVPFAGKPKRVKELLRLSRMDDVTEDIYEKEIKKALAKLRHKTGRGWIGQVNGDSKR